ncbi:O-antigen ligase family protein [Facilibium subflavum]|uniref:O-antigen ligase family protein n=1 Tax=Facilibium subflavum TaxID=2219058 RepID=UPI0013C35589|nr:O-antigen polymerase [Facilibium subflavum]
MPHKKDYFILLLYITTSLFFIGMFVKHTTALLTIGAYSSLLLCLCIFSFDWQEIKLKLMTLYKTYQILTILTVAFLLFAFITSVFASYHNFYMQSLGDLYKSLRYPIIFLFCTIVLSRSKFYIRYLYIIFFTTTFIILIVWPCILFFQDQLDSSTLVKNGVVNLGFLAPFILVTILIEKRKALTYLVSLTIALLFIYMIWSGSRSGFLAVSSSAIITGVAYAKKHQLSYKKIFLFCLFTLLSFFIVLSIAYHFSPRIQGKIHQTVTFKNFTSGRTTIVESRYPIISKYIGFWHGIGYGDTIYQTLLYEQNAPKLYGEPNTMINGKQQFYYYHDEPQLLVIYYSFGIFGTLLYLVFFIYFAYQAWRNRTLPGTTGILSYAIFSALVSYFLLRGIVEHSGITLLIWLVALQLTLTNHADKQ